MKRSLLIILIVMVCLDAPVFSQSPCQNVKTDSAAGATEKYVYKTYSDDDGGVKKLHIALTRPFDELPNKKRPLIIGLQGSAFVNTCFPEPCYIKYIESVLKPHFAARGFIVASIQYRLASPFSSQILKISDEKLKEIEYKAAQDARQAIKYIFDNAERFGVDTNNVFLVGTSAGAITALSAVYFDDEKMPQELSKKYGALEKRANIKAVISFSGAVRDLSYLKSNEKTPLMIVHGSDDHVVPFEKGLYLGLKNLTPVFGGKAIYEEAVKRRIPVKGYFYPFGHDYPSRFQTEVYQRANEFIRSYLTCAGSKN